MNKLVFPESYCPSEKRCHFYITSMVKRIWAAQLEVLSWIDEVCRKYGIRYIMCYGSLIGTVRHKGYIPWDDDIDIGMLRADYNRFLEVVPVEIPPYLHTVSLLPGAYEPREMIFNINTGRKIDTSPQYLERFHVCPYATGDDVFVFDRVPEDPEEFKYQDRLVRMLDRMLVLQWKVDEHTTSKEILQ
jgi:lipopolysaccharide cholinephosphotransferase